jgi:hypothetical protein
LGLPVGWDAAAKSEWTDWYTPWKWAWSQYGTALGWALTALLVMLGAPFWFDVLTKLASLRSTGNKPPSAGNDPASATSISIEEGAAGVKRTAATDYGSFEANLRAALGIS